MKLGHLLLGVAATITADTAIALEIVGRNLSERSFCFNNYSLGTRLEVDEHMVGTQHIGQIWQRTRRLE